jgi:hypothetical protein
MSSQSVTIQLSDPLLRNLRRRAEQACKPLEAEIVRILEGACPDDPDNSLSPELEMVMEALSLMEDHTLWNVASAKIPDSVTNQMEVYYTKRLAEGLSAEEECELAHMEKMFEKNVLVRAQAAMLLKERGLLEEVGA